ncbi:hypothetical protein QFC19_001946 [Naganishia cerealis]|uniref:Uncharacterized protein n=1 Tax=Naganishia cerealis TaxID=610337 RepID=A0ACC2WE75_9TREE|nr:hypothetical protein QFC19_001946 [Naganishia cerealis]
MATDRRRGVTQFTVHIPDANTNASTLTTSAELYGKSTRSASRWSSLEFKIYGLIFAVVVPLMVWVPIRLSQGKSSHHMCVSKSHPNYYNYAYKLGDGWIPGRKVDISDPQYRTFRQNIPALLALGGSYLLLSHAFTLIRPHAFPSASKTQFIVAFELGMLVILHGIGAVKIGLIVLLNWGLTRWSVRLTKGNGAPTWLTPTLVWTFNGLMLFANDYYEGYKLETIHPSLANLVRFSFCYA